MISFVCMEDYHLIWKLLMKSMISKESVKSLQRGDSEIWSGQILKRSKDGLQVQEGLGGFLDVELQDSSTNIMSWSWLFDLISWWTRDTSGGSNSKVWWPFGLRQITVIVVVTVHVWCESMVKDKYRLNPFPKTRAASKVYITVNWYLIFCDYQISKYLILNFVLNIKENLGKKIVVN